MPEVTPESLTAAEQAQAAKLKAMKEEWPTGQLVQLKGGDYPGNQGVVVDVVEKAMVPYVRVRLEVYGTGRRRPEDKQPLYDMRGTSLIKIEAYMDPPAPKPAPVATSPAEGSATPGTSATPSENSSTEASDPQAADPTAGTPAGPKSTSVAPAGDTAVDTDNW
jgi:hypothetical protein